jgi:glycosyltransferase involved in cell wall biosynthesis
LKRAVLITTGQPSINPRIVKEADALSASGFSVTVLFCFWIQWAEEADERLLKEVQWKYQVVGGAPTRNKLLYYFTKVRRKVNLALNKYLGNRLLFAERSQARCYDELLKAAKSIKADWYIGHNLGALPIAVRAATYHRASAGFDFEDYHREENSGMANFEWRRVVFLEETYTSALNYISSSSPLISDKVKHDFPGFVNPIITLVNSFPLSQQPEFRSRTSQDRRLDLFWFSQTIGKGRGLETLIEALNSLNDPAIYLTLAGRCNDDMNKYIQQNATNHQTNIFFAGVIQPEELPHFAANFDVGLALETGFSTNNNIALSNKIFTYLLAGNAIILSDTKMQKLFNEEYKVGENYMVNDAQTLASKILIYKTESRLNSQRRHNYMLAKSTLNWERESKNLLKVLQ